MERRALRVRFAWLVLLVLDVSAVLASKWSWRVEAGKDKEVLEWEQRQEPRALHAGGGAVRVKLDGDLTALNLNKTLLALKLSPSWTSPLEPSFAFATQDLLLVSEKDWLFLHGPLDTSPAALRAQLVGFDREDPSSGFPHPQEHLIDTVGHCLHSELDVVAVLALVLQTNFTGRCSVDGNLTINNDLIQLRDLDLCSENTSLPLLETVINQASPNLTVRQAFLKRIDFEDGLIVWIVPFFSSQINASPMYLNVSSLSFSAQVNGTAIEVLSHTVPNPKETWKYTCTHCPPTLNSGRELLCFLTQDDESGDGASDFVKGLFGDQIHLLSQFPSFACLSLSEDHGGVVQVPSLANLRVLGSHVLAPEVLNRILTLPLIFRSGTSGIYMLRAGNLKSVSTDGEVICTSFWGTDGVLCWEAQSDRLEILDIPKSNLFSSLQMGGFATHMCGISRNSTLFCFGSNIYRKIQPPGLSGTNHPIAQCYEYRNNRDFYAHAPVNFVSQRGIACQNTEMPFTQVSVSTEHNCAVSSRSAGVSCWGRSVFGKLGPCESKVTDTRRSASSSCVEFAGPVRSVKTGLGHSCALWLNGSTTCWGGGSFREMLGRPPLEVSFKSLAMSHNHACAIRSNDTVVQCWGADYDGETAAPSIGGFVELTLAERFSCGKWLNGTVAKLVCWGKIPVKEFTTLPFGELAEVQGRKVHERSRRFFQPLLIHTLHNKELFLFPRQCMESGRNRWSFANLSQEAFPQLGTKQPTCLSVLGMDDCGATLPQGLLFGDEDDSSVPVAYDGTVFGLNSLACPSSHLVIQNGSSAFCADFGSVYYQSVQVVSDTDVYDIAFYVVVAIASFLVLTYNNNY